MIHLLLKFFHSIKSVRTFLNTAIFTGEMRLPEDQSISLMIEFGNNPKIKPLNSSIVVIIYFISI